MSAGQLNASISIERRGAADDGFGNTVSTWAPLISGEPAEIRPMRASGASSEVIEANGVAAVGFVEVRVRYSSRTAQITESDRLKDARTGLAYNIRAIEQPDMRGKYLRIVCEKGVAHG